MYIINNDMNSIWIFSPANIIKLGKYVFLTYTSLILNYLFKSALNQNITLIIN